MGNYSKAKGRRNKQPFVMLRHDMFESPAWASLTCKARVAWTEVMRRYNGTNNGENLCHAVSWLSGQIWAREQQKKLLMS